MGQFLFIMIIMIFILHIYDLNWLDWKQINPGVDLLFLALMSGGFLPPGRYYDYEAMTDLGTTDSTLRMIIYFLCGGRSGCFSIIHILTKQTLNMETA